MTTQATLALGLDDIHAGALRPRPPPSPGGSFRLRIAERRPGGEVLRRLIPALASAADPADPAKQAWLALSLSFQGLKALGVPQASLDSFPPEFQQGMAARAVELGDVG